MTARAEEGVRGEVHGQVPAAPPPQAAGTQYFAMDVDEVLAAGGSRPDRLSPVSGPQERVQRHFVEQLVEPVRRVPVLDAPVPQLVDNLEDVLKIVDFLVPVQEIEVPKISSVSRPPLRRALQLVDMCHCRRGCGWLSGPMLTAGCAPAGAWRAPGTPSGPAPEGFTASPGR